MRSKHTLLLLALPFLITSCTKKLLFPAAEHDACSARVPTYQGLVVTDDDYVNKFVTEILDWRKVGRSYELKNMVFEIHHDPHYTLSAKYFSRISAEKDFLIYYHTDTADGSVPVCAKVQSNRLNERPDWYIGQALSDFQEKLEIKEKLGVVSIYGTEGNYVRLSFIRGALHQVWYSNGSID